jgi:uncharacterized OB-fold protein
VAIKREEFPLPDVDDPLTAPFFAHAARRELAVPRCDDCGRYIWYPAGQCPGCAGSSLTWTVVSGRGTLFAWAVVERAFLPAFADQVPFVTGLIALEEDPFVRVVSYVVDADPDSLVAEQPLVADFRPLSFPTVPDKSVVVPMFTPASDLGTAR